MTPLVVGRADTLFQGDENLPLGDRYRGVDYPMEIDADNGCDVGQRVSFTYPTEFRIDGPPFVDVPPHEITKVKMTLVLSRPPLSSAPRPPGAKDECKPASGTLVASKQPFQKSHRVFGGLVIDTCKAAQKTTVISMFLHQHAPPDAEMGGGGGKKKPHGNICNILWNFGEFFPAPGVTNPVACREELGAEAIQYFDAVEPLKKAEPWRFENLPKVPPPAELNRVSVDELLRLKQLYENAAREVKK
jgi:hypothetical protein